ncbi:hypothetical protein CDG81_11745 [Actinopolyspora erythraea]|uniref:Alpha/beta hydrolase n=1 Tax=Actinopolyspora erythraea TaxID=414996 RepID=A0A099D5Z1_9ACTN|nr:hypothetical protein [Actinopolyspora erythraea]ASU78839.1 hypothetical protein CDG81_11745 [Actinopolyspora erythraea]KGI81356.1 hypothetical protein IL38_11830 [Actinopolyspora erythraea]
MDTTDSTGSGQETNTVLVLDPDGRGAGCPPGPWSGLAETLPLHWFPLSVADDGLLQVRALLERQLDGGAGIELVAGGGAVYTALRAAAPHPKAVTRVLLATDEPLDEPGLTKVLERNGTTVRVMHVDTEPASGTDEVPLLARRGVADSLVDELREHHSR